MYAIINHGAIVGLCDTPNYIRVKDGIYTNAKKENAEGVAIGGVAYMFNDTTLIKVVDGGEITFTNEVKISNVNGELNDTEDALCEASEDFDQRIADIEDALCELTEE